MQPLELSGVTKTFTAHLQGGMRLPVLRDLDLVVRRGECVALTGPSGIGKSSVLKLIYGNYRCDAGAILVRDGGDVVDVASAASAANVVDVGDVVDVVDVVDVATAPPRQILSLRRRALGYVTQFLRAVPRVSALDIVAEALIDVPRETARAHAAAMLTRFNVPQRLWTLSPATFSGGEQQRVNLARGLLPRRPILLLDEPTASLDAANRAVVVDIVRERKEQGASVVAIVHDESVRDAIADTCVDVARFATAA